MKTSRLTFAFAAIAVLVAGAAVFTSAQTKPVPPLTVSSLLTGRYQIVNGTPTLARNIMLLDTATGDSWVICSAEDAGDLWCRMPRSAHATSPKPATP